MTRFETIFWWVGILVNVAAMALYFWASCVGDWMIAIRALAPLCFILILVASRRSITESRKKLAECDKLIRERKE